MSKVTVTLTSHDTSILNKLASTNNTTKSDIVRRAIRAYYKENMRGGREKEFRTLRDEFVRRYRRGDIAKGYKIKG